MNLRGRQLPAVLGSLVAGVVTFGFVLGSTGAKESIYKYLNVFAEVYSLVRSNYVDHVEDSALIDGACRGVVGGLDPFSGYLTREEFQAIQKDPQGGPATTGLDVLRIGGGAVIVGVRPSSAGEKAGLRPGDQIWSIEGTPSRTMSLLQVRRAQRGAAGSTAHILIYHPKTQKREELALNRALLSSPQIQSRILDEGLGYLKLDRIDRNDRDAIKTALSGLKTKGAHKLLFDLRNCTGGEVEDATRLANLFITSGTVVYVQERGAERVAKPVTGTAVWTAPITIMTNGGTAGGAEILAAALRSRVKAALWGETSYGLSSTQQFLPLPGGDGLLLSSAKLLGPDGEGWSHGLKPDQEILSTLEERAGLEPDRQLEKAIGMLRQPVAHAA